MKSVAPRTTYGTKSPSSRSGGTKSYSSGSSGSKAYSSGSRGPGVYNVPSGKIYSGSGNNTKLHAPSSSGSRVYNANPRSKTYSGTSSGSTKSGGTRYGSPGGSRLSAVKSVPRSGSAYGSSRQKVYGNNAYNSRQKVHSGTFFSSDRSRGHVRVHIGSGRHHGSYPQHGWYGDRHKRYYGCYDRYYYRWYGGRCYRYYPTFSFGFGFYRTYPTYVYDPYPVYYGYPVFLSPSPTYVVSDPAPTTVINNTYVESEPQPLIYDSGAAAYNAPPVGMDSGAANASGYAPVDGAGDEYGTYREPDVPEAADLDPYSTAVVVPPDDASETAPSAGSSRVGPQDEALPQSGPAHEEIVPEGEPEPGTSESGMSPREMHELMVEGVELFADGKYAEADERFRTVAEADAQNVDALLAHAVARFATGDYSMAAQAIRTGIELAPDVVNALFDIRDRYGRVADFDAHARKLTATVRQRPKDADALLILGFVQHFTREREAAARSFQRLKELSPADNEVAAAFLTAKSLEELEKEMQEMERQQQEQSQPSGTVPGTSEPAAGPGATISPEDAFGPPPLPPTSSGSSRLPPAAPAETAAPAESVAAADPDVAEGERDTSLGGFYEIVWP